MDLSDLVQRVVARLAQMAVDAGCTVALETPGPVPGVWDRLRTEQVISNLLSNALKYGAGKPVDVAIAVDDRVARVSITDRGIGIAAEKHGLIFDRFERAAPKTQYGGFGLGLWISRRALEEMGGTIPRPKPRRRWRPLRDRPPARRGVNSGPGQGVLPSRMCLIVRSRPSGS